MGWRGRRGLCRRGGSLCGRRSRLLRGRRRRGSPSGCCLFGWRRDGEQGRLELLICAGIRGLFILLTWVGKITVGFSDLTIFKRVGVENSSNHAMSLFFQ
jgi:hypothetical protein